MRRGYKPTPHSGRRRVPAPPRLFKVQFASAFSMRTARPLIGVDSIRYAEVRKTVCVEAAMDETPSASITRARAFFA